MLVLVINAGSTSVKFKLYDMTDESVLAEGNCQKVGREDAEFKFSNKNGFAQKQTLDIKTHGDALALTLKMLTEGESKVIDGMKDIAAVANRVCNGGRFDSTVLVDDELIREMEANSPLAPLHNPPQVKTVGECRRVFRDIPNTAGFDTAFHASIPPVAHLYAVPYEYYEKHSFRRYGYHGLSYQFVLERFRQLSGLKCLNGTRVVACHLGGGSSICAVKDGKSIENSFGLGTGQGPVCGTRAGTVDHLGLGYLMKAEGLSYDELENVLHRDSGLLGLSGISGDEYELEKAAAQGNARAELALDSMAYQIRGYIGSYAFNLGGTDAIIFTGGIGENSDIMREKILEGLGVFGIELDKNANVAFNRKEAKISAESSRTGIWVIPTNEEIVLARESVALLN
jgi:acetate kinase